MIIEIILAILFGALTGFIIKFFYTKIMQRRIHNVKRIKAKLEDLDKKYDVFVEGQKASLLKEVNEAINKPVEPIKIDPQVKTDIPDNGTDKQ